MSVARRVKLAVEWASEIGQRAADLANVYSDTDVVLAIRYLAKVNPSAFSYLRERLIDANDDAWQPISAPKEPTP